MSRDAAAASQDDSSLWFGSSTTAAPVRYGMLFGGGAPHTLAPQQPAETTTSTTLTEMLRKRREAVEAHRRLAVPEDIEDADAQDEVRDPSPPMPVADDASPSARLAARAPSGAAEGGRQTVELRASKKRPLCGAHDDMDQWLDACPDLPRDARQAPSAVVFPSASHSPSVRGSARRSGGAMLPTGLATSSVSGPRPSSSMNTPALRNSTLNGGIVPAEALGPAAPRASMESATRSMDAFFQAAANSGLVPPSPKDDRIDAILDAVCPFDEMRMIAGAQVEAAPSRRRSGQAAAMNPTAFATLDWLNRTYEQWKATTNSCNSAAMGRSALVVALSGTIRHVDTAFGIVSCVVEVSIVSDAMRTRLTSNASWAPPATHVVVVVDQSVYQALRLVIGDDVELGDPCFVFEGTVDTCFLPMVVASFCVCKAEHVAFQYHPLTDHVGLATRMGDIAADGAIPEQQQQRHHRHHQPLDWPSSGHPVGRGTVGSAGEQTGGPSMDWFVPSELLDSLLEQYHRLVRARNLSEGDSDSVEDDAGAPREYSTLSLSDAL